MTERWRQFAVEWGLADIPPYLGEAALPLFDLQARQPGSSGNLTVVYTAMGAVVGRLLHRDKPRVQDGAMETAVLTAELSPGSLVVSRHATLSWPNGVTSPCPQECRRAKISAKALTISLGTCVEAYPLKQAEFSADPAAFYAQSRTLGHLELLAMAPGETDIFSMEAQAGPARAALGIQLLTHNFGDAVNPIARDVCFWMSPVGSP